MRSCLLTIGSAVVFCLSIGGCAPLPAVDATFDTTDMPPPQLVPLDGILAQAAAPTGAQARADTLATRAARLKSRAGLMRGPVLDPATRIRLANAIRAGRA